MDSVEGGRKLARPNQTPHVGRSDPSRAAGWRPQRLPEILAPAREAVVAASSKGSRRQAATRLNFLRAAAFALCLLSPAKASTKIARRARASSARAAASARPDRARRADDTRRPRRPRHEDATRGRGPGRRAVAGCVVLVVKFQSQGSRRW